MSISNINLSGKIIALSLLALFVLVQVAPFILLLYMIIDMMFASITMMTMAIYIFDMGTCAIEVRFALVALITLVTFMTYWAVIILIIFAIYGIIQTLTLETYEDCTETLPVKYLLLTMRDIMFTLTTMIGAILYLLDQSETSTMLNFIIKFYVRFALMSFVYVITIVFILVVIPYLIHKLKKYNWIIYMCNFHARSTSDYLIDVFSRHIPIEIFNELKYPTNYELNLFDERLSANNYNAITLLLQCKHHRAHKFDSIMKCAHDNSNHQYIGTLINNGYHLHDIFNAALHNFKSIKLQFIDALLECGKNTIELEKLNIRVDNTNHMNLLDHILTNINMDTHNCNIESKLNRYLLQSLNSQHFININSVKILLKHGTDPNINNGSLLIKVAEQQKADVLDLLLAYGGDATINDHYLFKRSIARQDCIIARCLVNKYSFYNVLENKDNLTGHISNIRTMKSASTHAVIKLKN